MLISSDKGIRHSFRQKRKNHYTRGDTMVITISRQFGSRGREIGKALAEHLSIAFYDKELITLASQKSGISEKHFEKYDEKANSLLYTLSLGASAAVSTDYGTAPNVPIHDKLYLLQHDIIRQIAEEPCVIVGRCADHVLSDRNDCAKIFICADIDIRAAHVAERLHISKAKAYALIKKKDKSRANYYNYYASGKWGRVETYDYTFDSSILGIDGTVHLITQLIDDFEAR